MALALCLTLLPAPAWAAEADAPEGGTIVQEEQQEKAPAAESPAILEQAAENGIAAQNGGGSTVENAVAEVTSGGTPTQYTDIVDAFTAAQGAKSATVKLLKNVTIPKTADGYSYGIQLTGGNITLDLNGHTIQTTEVASGFVPLNAVFYIDDGSGLTVQDSTGGGKIVQPNGGQAIGVINGNLTMKSGIIEVTSDSADADNATTQNCAVFVRVSGVADIQGGTLIGNRGIYVGGVWGGGTLTVSGAPQIQGRNSYALQVKDGTVTLSGGTYTGAEPCSIYNSNGTAASLLASGYRFQSDGSESEYSDDTHGVVGDTTVAKRPANEFSYVDENGKEQTQANCTPLTADGFQDVLAGETTWFAANTSFTADDPLQVLGTVNLILCDGVTVTLNKGISLSGSEDQPGTLNIYAQSGGTGKLICGGASNSTNAGIYISTGTACTTALNIYGGDITATGSFQAGMSADACGAGIGTSANDKNGSTMTVNIFGGTVTAMSGGEGAQAIGNGTNAKGTVTVNIAPGMKCVRTDDLNTECAPGNTDGTSVTVTKCENHTWEYTDNGETHTKTCTLCHANGESKAHSPAKYVSVGDSQHKILCVCGKELETENHTVQYTPNADGLTHKTRCNRCGWTSADEKHNFQSRVCVCGTEKSAEYGGQEYASLQAAINAAAADGGTVTLARDVSENVTVAGGTVTVDLSGKNWRADISKNPVIWGGRIPLTVTGGSVTLENGTLYQGYTSSMGSYGIRIQGGSVTVKGNAVVIGSNTTGSADNISYPAIILESGDLTLETGATLVHGLKVPEGKHLSDYLPEGTAFGLRGYDESTGMLTGDKRLFADAYTTNAYNVPDMALVVVEHTKHDFKLNSDGKYICACGYVCPHNEFKDGKCTICGNGCAHTNVDDDGVCRNCKMQMAVKSETGGTVTYGTDFRAAMNAAENGTTVTLLADIELGTTPQSRAAITGDGKIVTLDLNGHKITSGWLDVGNGKSPTACTLKIIGKGSYEPPLYGGIITVNMKATLDLSEWEGGTISSINISDSSDYEAETREAAVIVGPKAGTIGKLAFGNNQLSKITKTKLSGGSFNEIWVAGFGQPVKLGELLADGYAYQNADGSYVKYQTTLRDASIYNVKVVKCLHPNMKPDATTGIATCEYCGKSGKFVASVDGNLYTADQWKDAFKAWLGDAEDEKANGILKLYTDYKAEAADATWSVGYRPNGNTLDLNGHTMSVQNDGAFKPTHNMHLTVTDGKEIGQITNILLDGSQGGSFTLESGYVCNLEMTGGAVVTLEGGSVDTLDVRNSSANTNLSIQGGSLGKLNIEDWANGMHVSATGGSLGGYTLPSGKILADVLDHQYYAEGTSLDRQVDTAAQNWKKFDIKQAPYDFGSTSKAANVPINGSIPFRVDSPSENVGLYEVKWYRRTNSGAEHMVENKVAGVNVNDTLEVFCVITGVDRPGGEMQWQVAVKGYTIKVVPAKLNGDQTVITQKPNTGNTGNPADNRLVVTPLSSNALSDVEYKFAVTYNGRPLELGKDYTIKDSSNWAKNAGTHTLTIEGMGNYTGEKSVTWTLEPYELSVENFCYAKIEKMYDGTDAVTDSTNGINGLGGFIPDSKNLRNPILSTVDVFNLGESDYQLSNMKFDSAEAGDRTFTGTMTLTSGGNFVFAGGSRVMQIEYSSGRVSVSINRATIAAPAAKALQVANNHAATYTVDLSALLPALEAPREYGAVTYGAPTVNLSSGYYTEGARVEDGKLILPIQAVKTDTTGSIGSVQVKVSTTNYHDFTLTINVSAENRITPTGTPTLSKNAITYGDALNTIALSGKLHDNVNNVDVDGTFEWVDGTHIPVVGNGTYAAEWIFEPTDTEKYLTVSGRSNITVEKAQPYGKVSMAGYTYGQMPSMPSLTEQTGDPNAQVTYYYSSVGNGNMQVWSINDPPALNAGTYSMFARIGATSNYNENNAEYCEFVVAKATPTYTAPTGLTAKYGQTLADVKLSNPEGNLDGTWSWMNSSESVGDASTVTKTFQAKFTPKDTENYNTVENIELEVMVNKVDGRNLKTVELEQKYTDTSEHTYTPDWAGLPAGQDWTFSSEATIVLPKQDFAADGSLLTYAISGGKAGDKITITLKASCDNYEDFTITLNVTLTEKDDQKSLTITGGTTVVYGQTLQLGTSGGNGNGAVTYAVTNGTGEATIDATGKLTPVKVGKVKVRATKAGDASYNSITSSPVEITITRATPTGEPAYTKITASGKTLADAALGIGTITPAGGTIAWDDPTTTEVVANKSYGWTYTPTDTNYTTLTGSIQLWHKSTSSGGGSYYAPTVPDMPMLYRGCTGDAVKTLQDKLNTLGYNSGNVDGIFGAKTYAAVTAFQKANSLGVDGIVGKLTWAKLYGVSPAMPVETTVVGRPMVSYGSRGDAVHKLQELLNALGYDCGSVDGIFGSKTKAAVLAFQKANRLAADGIVGPLTWGKLV